MKYTIKLTSENNIIGLFKHISKRTVVRNSKGIKVGVNEFYKAPEQYTEITETEYNELKAFDNLYYTKYIDGVIIPEPTEEKEARLKLAEENKAIQLEAKEKQELIQLLNKLKPYVKLTAKATKLLYE